MELHKALFGKTGRTAFPEFGKVVDVFFTIKLLAVVDIEIQNEAIVINANMQQVRSYCTFLCLKIEVFLVQYFMRITEDSIAIIS